MMPKNSATPSKETEAFVDLARKLVSIPKKEIDRRLEQERQRKETQKDKRQKA